MNKLKTIQARVEESYVIMIVALLGVFSIISAAIIAWPALAYLGSKLAN